MERFLRYSLEKQRGIRLIFLNDEGVMKQVNAQVLALDASQVRFACLRPRGEWTLPLERILSADYRRGDEAQD